MRHGLLAEEEDLVDVIMLSRAGSYARIDLLELRHDRKHFILDNLCSRAMSADVRLVCAEDDRHIDAERSEIGHPKEGHALIAIMI